MSSEEAGGGVVTGVSVRVVCTWEGGVTQGKHEIGVARKMRITQKHAGDARQT
jgi:hypothetical protein